MEKTRGPYQEEFPVGSLVKIAERAALEDFARSWQLHNILSPEQLNPAGKVGNIKSVGFYHRRDELYQIEGIPGIWHEQYLEPCASTSRD